MITSAKNQSFLILTNAISRRVIQLYTKIEEAVAGIGEVYLLYHSKDNKVPAGFEGIKIETFTNDILNDLGYRPIRQTLVPGSNHFPVLNFFLKYPGYSHYWCLEDDVAFNGSWQKFIKNISAKPDYDFISSHIRRYEDIPDWHWWQTSRFPEKELQPAELYSSFNPIYRISNKALRYIDYCLKNGYEGHHEVLFPTLLKKEGFEIADFASENNCVTPNLRYCTLDTMRWKPIFFAPGNKKNKLYHPVKEKITIRQILVFIKRTFLNKTKYFD